MGQQSIAHYMSSSNNKNQTPNKGKQNAVERSPPTPAEKLNEDSKKSCHKTNDSNTHL